MGLAVLQDGNAVVAIIYSHTWETVIICQDQAMKEWYCIHAIILQWMQFIFMTGFELTELPLSRRNLAYDNF